MQSENISTPICVECVFIWSFVSGLDIQLEQFDNDNPVCKNIGCKLRNMTSQEQFFSLNWYYPTAMWLR